MAEREFKIKDAGQGGLTIEADGIFVAKTTGNDWANRIVACLKRFEIFSTDAISNGRAIQAIKDGLLR
jgi:hypothetical protein